MGMRCWKTPETRNRQSPHIQGWQGWKARSQSFHLSLLDRLLFSFNMTLYSNTRGLSNRQAFMSRSTTVPTWKKAAKIDIAIFVSIELVGLRARQQTPIHSNSFHCHILIVFSLLACLPSVSRSRTRQKPNANSTSRYRKSSMLYYMNEENKPSVNAYIMVTSIYFFCISIFFFFAAIVFVCMLCLSFCKYLVARYSSFSAILELAPGFWRACSFILKSLTFVYRFCYLLMSSAFLCLAISIILISYMSTPSYRRRDRRQEELSPS